MGEGGGREGDEDGEQEEGEGEGGGGEGEVGGERGEEEGRRGEGGESRRGGEKEGRRGGGKEVRREAEQSTSFFKQLTKGQSRTHVMNLKTLQTALLYNFNRDARAAFLSGAAGETLPSCIRVFDQGLSK